MDTSASTPPLLSSLFAESQQLYSSLELSSVSSSDEKFQSTVKTALNNFKTIAHAIERNGIFSTNEELDDINTSSLKYLLVNYYLGELYQQLNDASERTRNLKAAKTCLATFLQQCENLKLVHKDDIKFLHRDGSVDDKTKREEKISRLKRDREVNAKLAAILMKKRETATKAATGTVINANNEDEDIEDDDEDMRQFQVLLITAKGIKAIESLDMLNKELEMLEKMEQLKIQHGGKLPPSKEDSKPTPFTTFTIVPNQREKLKHQVFKPGWTQAVLTPEEWAELQMQNGTMNIAQGTTNPKKKTEDEMTEEEMEEKRKKDAAWDDWKDEHPKGEGNKNDFYFKRG